MVKIGGSVILEIESRGRRAPFVVVRAYVDYTSLLHFQAVKTAESRLVVVPRHASSINIDDRLYQLIRCSRREGIKRMQLNMIESHYLFFPMLPAKAKRAITVTTEPPSTADRLLCSQGYGSYVTHGFDRLTDQT